jgi:hypothetical protein
VQYEVEKIDNPPFKPNVEFIGFEDLSHPGFKHLIDTYQLDTVFHVEMDEFKRILLLRKWIKSVIKIDDYGDPYPGGGSAEGILDAALEGTRPYTDGQEPRNRYFQGTQCPDLHLDRIPYPY